MVIMGGCAVHSLGRRPANHALISESFDVFM
jgi:hypothetical protein